MDQWSVEGVRGKTYKEEILFFFFETTSRALATLRIHAQLVFGAKLKIGELKEKEVLQNVKESKSPNRYKIIISYSSS